MVSILQSCVATVVFTVALQNPPQPGTAQAPQNPLVKEAQQLANDGKHAAALENYRKALAADPKLAEAHLGAGRMLDLLGKHEEARQHLSKAIELAGPDLKDQARTAMAVSYVFESRAADAAKYYEQVFNDRLAAGNFRGAAATANALGRVYLETGDPLTASDWYFKGIHAAKKIAGVTPAEADLWQMRQVHGEARIAARRGDKEKARIEAALMKELLDTGQNAGERPQYHYLLGYIALEAGDADTAIAELQKATQSDPFILGLIARAYEKKGDAEKAAEFHQKALAAGTAHSINTAFARQWARRYLKR